MAKTITITLRRADGMPSAAHGLVMTGTTDHYTILLNAGDPPARQLAAFLHEMTHIYNGDLTEGQDVQEIEARTHRQLLEALEIIKQEGET